MTVAVAALVDATWGELPTSVHPVVGMGRWLDRSGRWALRVCGPRRQVLAGGAAWAVGVAGVWGVARFMAALLRALPVPLGTLVGGAALSTLLSWRLLDREVAAVEVALAADPTGVAGRRQVRRLVSRDVDGLSPAQVRGAALSSLAENLSDSVVAPLCWYAVGGLPAAAAYRFVNTADAVWGYRDHRLWTGRVAARADDVANLVPARLTAVLVSVLTPRSAPGPRATGAATAPPVGAFAALGTRRVAALGTHRVAALGTHPIAALGTRRVAALRTHRVAALRAGAARTPSPNAGWPMAALATALDVRLEKRGVYVLHPDGREPMPVDVLRARRAGVRVTAGAVVLASLVSLTRDATRRIDGLRP